MPADNVPPFHIKAARATGDEVSFRSYHNYRAGIHCRVHSKPLAWLGSVGLFGNDVQPFRTDMPAVFGAVVFSVSACGTDL